MISSITIHIRGMHCRSCELLLEKSFLSIPSITSVHISYHTGIAEICYSDNKPSMDALYASVRAAGYTIGSLEQKTFFSTDPQDYIELFISIGFLAATWMLLDAFGLFDFSLNFGSSPSISIVLLIGLIAGVSSCAAIVGGLVLGFSARHAEIHPEATMAQKFRPHLYFNLGRLISFAIFGGIIGLLGSAFRLSVTSTGFLIAIVGALMMILGLKLIRLFPFLDTLQFTLPTALARRLGVSKDVKEYSHRGAFVVGALTFFLPCGFTQAMQLYAISTGNFWWGGIIMFTFALGNTPGLLGIGALSSVARGDFGRYFFKFVGLAIIAFGAFNLRNGLTLADVPITPQASIITEPIFSFENGFQIVRMEQGLRGYSPRQLTVKRGVPVRWMINSVNQYTCASSLYVPALGLSRTLDSGINIIEFTPNTLGEMRFTCSMGMFSGAFNVVE